MKDIDILRNTIAAMVDIYGFEKTRNIVDQVVSEHNDSQEDSQEDVSLSCLSCNTENTTVEQSLNGSIYLYRCHECNTWNIVYFGIARTVKQRRLYRYGRDDAVIRCYDEDGTERAISINIVDHIELKSKDKFHIMATFHNVVFVNETVDIVTRGLGYSSQIFGTLCKFMGIDAESLPGIR